MSIYIVGAGGLGREMAITLWSASFLDDAERLHGRCIGDRRVVGTIESRAGMGVAYIGVGDPAIRARLAARLAAARLEPLEPHVHPSVVCLRGIIGAGTFVAVGAVLTVDITIGKHAAILNNAVIGHDATVGDCAVICPGALISGGCQVGARAFIGAGAVLLPRVSIGADAIVGAGAVVTKDVAAGTTAVGNPARAL